MVCVSRTVDLPLSEDGATGVIVVLATVAGLLLGTTDLAGFIGSIGRCSTLVGVINNQCGESASSIATALYTSLLMLC